MNTKTKHWAGITAGILSLAGCASAANFGSEKYTYDASGNIIEKSIDGIVTKMSYDQTNRVIANQANSQRKATISYDGAGRLAAEGAENGKLRSTSYGYGDKVIAVNNKGHHAGFYYNAEGQLVGKAAGGDVSAYSWDGNVLAAEGFTAFTNESHITGGIPVLESGSNILISDYLGNTLSSAEKGFANTAYGKGLEEGRFTGKLFVKELNAYVFQCRFYDPDLNRWLTEDPSGFPDGNNNWQYAGGNPITHFDPDGREWKDLRENPSLPEDLVDTFPTPSGTAQTNTVQYTNGNKWDPQSWHTVELGTIRGNPGDRLDGNFSIGLTVEYSVTISGKLLSGGITLTNGGSMTKEVHEDALGPKIEMKANAMVVKANVYKMKHGWTYFQGWNMHPGDHLWESNLKIGNLYKGDLATRVQYQEL